MTKHDWLVLFLRITGLYFFITHFSVLVSSLSSLALAVGQKGGPMRWEQFPWQILITAAIVITAGVVLLTKAHPLAKWIERFDQ